MEDIEINSDKDRKICMEEVHPSSPSHELLSNDHSSSKKDDEWEAYLKSLEEMDEASMDKEWQLYLENLKEFNDEEDLTTDLGVSSQKEINSDKSFLIDSDEVMIDTQEEIYSHVDKEEEGIILRNSGTKFSHLSIDNQGTIEDQMNEEIIVNNDIQ
jgi:hypothetical protein